MWKLFSCLLFLKIISKFKKSPHDTCLYASEHVIPFNISPRLGRKSMVRVEAALWGSTVVGWLSPALPSTHTLTWAITWSAAVFHRWIKTSSYLHTSLDRWGWCELVFMIWGVGRSHTGVRYLSGISVQVALVWSSQQVFSSTVPSTWPLPFRYCDWLAAGGTVRNKNFLSTWYSLKGAWRRFSHLILAKRPRNNGDVSVLILS
jgi:hypothetical protein